MRQYDGKTKLILKHLGFLTSEHNFKFVFQTFDDYNGFNGPIDAYSFYNEKGCFTIHNVVQKGEWGWFKSKRFSTDQYELLNTEISQRLYITKRIWFDSTMLKFLAHIVKNEIQRTHCLFGIEVPQNHTNI